jgi:hypothetical protein
MVVSAQVEEEAHLPVSLGQSKQHHVQWRHAAHCVQRERSLPMAVTAALPLGPLLWAGHFLPWSHLLPSLCSPPLLRELWGHFNFSKRV